MARTQTEILDAIRADFVANLTLQEAYGLDPELTFAQQFSTVSLEAIITYIVASAIYLHELIVDQKATELETQIAAEYPFSFAWYEREAKKFQLGDTLAYDEATYKFTYPVFDEDKQIIKYVAIRQREVSGVTTLQVFAAKADKVALSAPELAAFSTYMEEIAAAGTHFQFISLAPDQLEIESTIVYDPQVIDGNGNSLADGTNTVETAINSYLNGIKYSGIFNRTKLVDAIQQAAGVLDVALGDVYLNAGLNNAQSFESPSGFFEAYVITTTYTAGNKNDY